MKIKIKLLFGLFVLICIFLPKGQVFAGVNDFTITNFQAEYDLSKDTDGRSMLQVKETIVAEFPSFDQNHGIERAIPNKYDNHPTHLKIQSVQKPDGSAWEYTTRTDGNATVFRIGDADRYVQGMQTYVIRYSLQDVTKFFSDTNDDELYWDTNGTGWLQPFEKISAVIRVDQSLVSSLTGKQSCYQGPQGSSEPCTITEEPAEGGKKIFKFTSTRALQAGENVTFAIGFEPHTFAAYKQSAFEKWLALGIVIFTASLFVTGFVGLGLIIWFIVHYYRNKYRKGDMGPIAPEYLPPKDTSVLVSAKTFSEGKGNPQSAQIIDLAVRHYINIYQTEDKGLFHSAEYEIELVKPVTDLQPEVQTFATTLFGGRQRLALKSLKNNTALYRAFRSNDSALTKALTSDPYNLYERDHEETRWFRRAAFLCLVFGIITLSPFMLVAAAVAFGFSFTTVQVSEKGLALERYLYGLRDYIKLAETERLRMLQSPEGAEKVGEVVDGQNSTQLIKLYERVLPYAVLFGEEKQWNEQLSKYYEQTQTQPVWYHGSAPFTAAAFSSAMSSFNSAASYSSSSGGSSGGGSSGGGGGGGGGGGW